MFTQNTSIDVVLDKEGHFGGPVGCVSYLYLYIFEKPPFWGPILTGLEIFFAAENHFNIVT